MICKINIPTKTLQNPAHKSSNHKKLSFSKRLCIVLERAHFQQRHKRPQTETKRWGSEPQPHPTHFQELRVGFHARGESDRIIGA